MAERWQQWMPFHINRWRGSAHVQAMKAAARAGYLYLLAEAWQTEDCTLPIEDEELQVLAGLTEAEWVEFGPKIRKRFKVEDGRLVNEVLRMEWHKARVTFHENYSTPEEISAARSAAGIAGNKKRWGNRKPIANDRICDSQLSQEARKGSHTETGTSTGTKKEPKQPQAAFVLPDSIDRKAWDGYEEMRRKKRCALTDHGRELCLKKLESLKRAGHDPTAVLNQSTMNGWQGLFEIKGASNGIPQQNRTDAATERQRTSQDNIRAAAARRYGVGGTDGPGTSVQAKPDAPSRDSGPVSPGVGGDSPDLRDGAFQGRTLEGVA